jgi:hypothetical protein
MSYTDAEYAGKRKYTRSEKYCQSDVGSLRPHQRCVRRGSLLHCLLPFQIAVPP